MHVNGCKKFGSWAPSQNYIILVPSNLTLHLFFKHKDTCIGAKAALWLTQRGLLCSAAALQRNAGTNIAEFHEFRFWEVIGLWGWMLPLQRAVEIAA